VPVPDVEHARIEGAERRGGGALIGHGDPGLTQLGKKHN
jgi:hypothetical protein